MPDKQTSYVNNSIEAQSPQCQFFVVRKKRLCRMTVRPGRTFCGEHEPQPRVQSGQNDTRIPCPNDPKHTCYASKLEKHLSICNARSFELPAYIVPGVNAPAPPSAAAPRRPLSQLPRDKLFRIVEKVNRLYDEIVKDNILEVTERPIHAVVSGEYSEPGRAESSRRHLRQVSSLLWLAEDEGLVRDGTCYVELGAGKGHLSYYAWRAWCAGTSGSRVLLVDRASLRHKRDNKLAALARGPVAHDQGTSPASPATDRPAGDEAPSTRLRADLAHLALEAVPGLRGRGIVGLAKHLCGAATDYALRCLTAPGMRDKTRGLVLAACCHHRCDHTYFGREYLKALGVDDEDLETMFGVVSWGTCGDGRPRGCTRPGSDAQAPGDGPRPEEEEISTPSLRARTGRRAAALLEWGRVLGLRARGLRARLARLAPKPPDRPASPEDLLILATLPASPS